MSIERRLYLLISLALLALAILAGNSAYQTARVFNLANFANVNTVPSLLTLDDAYSELSHMRIKVWQHISETDAAQKAEMGKAIQGFSAQLAVALDKYEKEDVADDRDKSLLQADRAALAAYLAEQDKTLALSSAGNGEQARAQQFSIQPLVDKLDQAIEAHRRYNESIGKKGAAAAETALGRANWVSVLVALAAVGAIGALGIFLARRIVASLGAAVRIAQTVAAGDLTASIDTSASDETGLLLKALKGMNDNLRTIVVQVRGGTDAIATASGEITSGNLDLSARTEQQAGALEETASSMEELTSTVKQNAGNAHQADALASIAADSAAEGGRLVAQVVETMAAISAASRQIGDIISVIDGIAFQTNILALNAAVEAARAGEQGRGFAVVATEVRNLAHRSATAAKEIKVLIENSVGQVAAGSKLVDNAGAAMEKIVGSIRRVTEVVGEISLASREQSAGIEQINQAIIHMDEATQQNAALVEQAAAAATALEEQAGGLARVVSVFILGETAAARGTAPSVGAIARPRASVPLLRAA